MEYFRSGDFAEFLIDNHMGRECIILRGDSVDLDENSEAIDETDSTNKKGKQGELDYDDKNVPFDIASARELLQDYNALLRKTHIDISSKEQPFIISEYYNRRLGHQSISDRGALRVFVATSHRDTSRPVSNFPCSRSFSRTCYRV